MCAARATFIPSERMFVVVRDKTPSFDLCQVDMYGMAMKLNGRHVKL